MRVAFARTKVARAALGDPRLSLEERYRSERDYVEAVKAAAHNLVRQRLLLQPDADAIVRIAAERYRSAISAGKQE